MKKQTKWRPRLVIALGLTVMAGIAGCLSGTGPVAILASSVVTGPAPLEIGFDLSYSTHPTGRTISYTLDFGDDSEPASGTEFGVILHHTYEESGTYQALLTVTDDQGELATDSLTITVSSEGPPVGIEIGETAPDFTAHTTDGGEVTFSDLRGQVVLLDFWGEWCTPCKKSLPHLDDLIDTYGEQGLVAVLVSTDAVEQDAIDFLDRNGYTNFISVWEPGGKQGNPIAQLYGVSSSSVGIPRTYLIDRQGVIRYVGHPLDLTGEIIEILVGGEP